MGGFGRSWQGKGCAGAAWQMQNFALNPKPPWANFAAVPRCCQKPRLFALGANLGAVRQQPSNLSPGGASPESRGEERAAEPAAFTCSSSQAAWLQNNSGSQTSPPWGKLGKARLRLLLTPQKRLPAMCPEAEPQLRGGKRHPNLGEGTGCPRVPREDGAPLRSDASLIFHCKGDGGVCVGFLPPHPFICFPGFSSSPEVGSYVLPA